MNWLSKIVSEIVAWFQKEEALVRSYGFLPSLPDFRDWLFAETNLAKNTTEVPASVDLRSLCSPVEDQGQLGSCTSHGLAGAVQFLEVKDKDKVYADLSRLFIYYNERMIEGTTKTDSGAQIKDGIKSLVTYGACPETEWPYTISKFKTKPSVKCYTDALKNVITSYYKVVTQNDIQTALAAGFPVVFGIPVYASFETQAVANTGIVPMPAKGEQLLGGHCMLIVGYDTSKSWYIVKNSWGTGWGDKGYCYIPFAYISSMGSDMWVISKDKSL